MDILFFSRGRGRGHATPDVAIIAELLRIDPTISVQLVSYGTGAETIRAHGYGVIDLHLTDTNPFLETMNRSIRIMNESQPLLIVAHEEFCIPPAAHLLDIPCIFLTDWFPPAASIQMESLAYADTILFMDDPGYFEEPIPLTEKIRYVGPVIRDLKQSGADKRTVRESLGWPPDGPILLILPGGAIDSSEEKSPIFDLVTSAAEEFGEGLTTVWVLPREEQEGLRLRCLPESKPIFMLPHVAIEDTILASDVVITKATRKTSFELNALGMPSISISYGLNPIDDYRVPQIKTNHALRAKGLTPTVLANHIRQLIHKQVPATLIPANPARGRLTTVSEIFLRLRTLQTRNARSAIMPDGKG